jgi:hypothetical protein
MEWWTSHRPPRSRMRIVALLAWYREDPGWLRDTIQALAHVPADHLIAIDGAYDLYPGGEPRSTLPEYEAIITACEGLGIGLTLHTPQATWAGNECEKRSKLFELGDQEATPEDWFLVIDADEIITTAPADLRDQLAATPYDVAAVTFSEPHPTLKRRDYPMPILFRAGPGIQVVGNHFTYKTLDGRYLWGNATTDDLEPRLDLTATFRLEHLTHYRDLDRRITASEYYQRRKENVTEDFICGHPTCEATASYSLPIHWHPNEGGYVAEWIWVCSKHQPEFALRGCQEMASHVGWDRAAGYYTRKLWLTASDDLAVENRAGPVPA